MIAFNHALTGALIGLSSGRPLIAVPAAFLSHYICDALPHYGNGDGDQFLRSRRFAVQLAIDAGLCVSLVIVLALIQPAYWLLAAFCAFMATSPDFAWMPGYIRLKRGEGMRQNKWGWIMQFAARIQWFERPIGAYVELAWAIGAITLLVAYL